jgi:hypothetical protein
MRGWSLTPDTAADPLLGEVLNRRALKAATAIGLKCRVDGMRFIPPPTLFGEFWYRVADTRPIERRGRERVATIGLLQFTLYAPEPYDDARTIEIANHLVEAFSRKKWRVASAGHVEIGQLGVVPIPRIRQGRRVTVVDASFQYRKRDSAVSLTV